MSQQAQPKESTSIRPAFKPRAERIVLLDEYQDRLADLMAAEMTVAERRALDGLREHSEEAVMGAMLNLDEEMSAHLYYEDGDTDGDEDSIDGVYIALSQKALLQGAGNSQLLRRHFALQNLAFDQCEPCNGPHPPRQLDVRHDRRNQ